MAYQPESGYEHVMAANTARRGPLRFEEGVATDTDIPADFGTTFDTAPTDFGTLNDLPTDYGTFAPVPVALAAAPKTNDDELAALPSAASNRFEDSSSGAAAIAVGVAAVLCAIALSFGDRLLGRTTRRRIP